MSDEEMTFGRFVSKKKTRPATVIDCSGWVDPSESEWTLGRFVSRKKTRPATVVDCSDWAGNPSADQTGQNPGTRDDGADPAPELPEAETRLTIRIHPGASLDQVVTAARGILEALASQSPGLTIDLLKTVVAGGASPALGDGIRAAIDSARRDGVRIDVGG